MPIFNPRVPPRMSGSADWTDRMLARPSDPRADPWMVVPYPETGDSGFEKSDSGAIIQDGSWVAQPDDYVGVHPVSMSTPSDDLLAAFMQAAAPATDGAVPDAAMLMQPQQNRGLDAGQPSPLALALMGVI